MKIVSVWNPKGGQGKSMISLNLAASAVDIGLKPVVICQDKQGTSTLFYQDGELPFTVLSELPDKSPDSDLVIIDHQANDWEIPAPKLLLMPVQPERSQYATYADAYKKAKAVNKRIITVVTNGNRSRRQEKDTVLALLQRGAFEIRSSGVFSRAASHYKTIFDASLNKAYNVNDRRQEFKAILAAVLQEEVQKHVAA